VLAAQLLANFGHARPQLGTQVICALVVRHDRQHPLQRGATRRVAASAHAGPRPQQHELEPELELSSHVDTAAEHVGDGQKFLLGAGRHQVTTNGRAIRTAIGNRGTVANCPEAGVTWHGKRAVDDQRPATITWNRIG